MNKSSNNFSNKIILGTANFGSKYGHFNNQIDIKQHDRIIKYLKSNKITSLDWSFDYPNSFTTIQKYFLRKINVDSKLSINSLNKDLNFLNSNKIKFNTIYIRSPEILDSSSFYYLFEIINKLKEFNIIKRIGYSIYDINLLEKKNYPKPDVLQIPINIFDQRFLKTKYNNKYYKKNTTIVARSIFLQGKLLSSRDKYFSKIENTHYTKFYNFLRLNNISAMSFIKSFYASIHTIDKIILGISDLKNLKDFVNSNYKIYNLKTFNAFSTNNKKIIDPRKWQKY